MTQPSQYGEFDYIIVGAGIGGLVIASRLSENDSVLLVEAGPDRTQDPRVSTPGLTTTLYGDNEVDWDFMTEPQVHVNGRQIPQPRGRMIGGSSSLNFSMVMYPSQQDFEAWERLGNKQWGAERMAPYLRKFHKYPPPDHTVAKQLGLDAYLIPSDQGSYGPLPVSFPASYGVFNQAWDETFARLGWQNEEDPINGTKLGAFTCPLSVNANDSSRGSASVYSIDRSTVTLLTETRVEKILFDSSGSLNRRPKATGSLQSPQLLELSGVGNPELLQKCGITVIVDLPSVGENLQDHCISSISYKVAEDQVSGDIMRDSQVAQSVMELYQKTRTGPMAGMPISVAYLPLVDGRKQASPDIRRNIISSRPSTNGTSLSMQTQAEIVAQILRDGEATAEYMFLPLQIHAHPGATSMADLFEKKADGNYISILAMLSHPFSRGSVHIKSSNINDKPVFEPAYLDHPLDLEILARHTQYIDQIARSEPFASLIQPDVRIPDVSNTPDLSDLDAAKSVVKDRLLSCFHPAGSCSMMPVELGGSSR
ncbi:aryl-alcohol dehydrogenase [Penicillium hetheringtonii]|uniref:Aryl-alcohol dehydrogenase n=1 Tax=Penicillium hetheringtonii TaxID=911720 RepID=A0AAD6DGL4_9EURO|nr:aryl-alcohol dehydrogenase [Penicillium hetheringtonii]